jgi:hypothetical protein
MRKLVLLAAILMAATPAFGQEIDLLRDFEVEVVDRGRATAPVTTGEVEHFSFVSAYTDYLVVTYGEDAVRNKIEAVTAAMNTVHEDSGTLLRFPLSGMERTSYAETGDLNLDHDWYQSVRPCDGTVRVLFVGKGVAGGVAGSPGPGENWEPCYAPTSVINLGPLLENKTTTSTYGRLLAHEIGHGVALAHQCTPDQDYCGVCYSNGTGSVMSSGCGATQSTFRPEVVGYLNAGVPYFSTKLASVEAPPLTCPITPCFNDDETMCLLGPRFKVTGSWRTADGNSGTAQAFLLNNTKGAGSGYFWFFDDANIEIVVKMLDGCGPFDRFWAFLFGGTNVEVEINICDTFTGKRSDYTNTQGVNFQPLFDTNAFATCP